MSTKVKITRTGIRITSKPVVINVGAGKSSIKLIRPGASAPRAPRAGKAGRK